MFSHGSVLLHGVSWEHFIDSAYGTQNGHSESAVTAPSYTHGVPLYRLIRLPCTAVVYCACLCASWQFVTCIHCRYSQTNIYTPMDYAYTGMNEVVGRRQRDAFSMRHEQPPWLKLPDGPHTIPYRTQPRRHVTLTASHCSQASYTPVVVCAFLPITAVSRIHTVQLSLPWLIQNLSNTDVCNSMSKYEVNKMYQRLSYNR